MASPKIFDDSDTDSTDDSPKPTTASTSPEAAASNPTPTPSRTAPNPASVTSRERVTRPVFLRTYNHTPRRARNPEFALFSDFADDDEDGTATTCEIWQAARATSAAPLYFPSVRIDDREMHDGGFGLNNPSIQSLRELIMAGDALQGGVFVSIGTGDPYSSSRRSSMLRRNGSYEENSRAGNNIISVPGISSKIACAQRAVVAATNTSNADMQMAVFAPQLGLKYFRFDVPGITDVELDEWKKMEFLEERTRKYLEDKKVKGKLDECARLLVENRRIRK